MPPAVEQETHHSPSWCPSATLHSIQIRARANQEIRQFFAQAQVLEVETPVLTSSPVSDPHIQCIATQAPTTQHQPELAQPLAHWLRSSPEYFHKRLLAAGSGDIYELGKVFRRGEAGRWHNPEFTMLEWYRVGWDYHSLMDEVERLVQQLLRQLSSNPASHNTAPWPSQRLSYCELHQSILNIDPFSLTEPAWRDLAQGHGYVDAAESPLAVIQDFIYGVAIRQHLPQGQLSFIYDFPPYQAALARIRPGSPAVAERFELFMGSVEIANGYQELSDSAEQRQRFAQDQNLRQQYGLAQVPMDEHFLSALDHGLPECAGVALGVDRLLAQIQNSNNLTQVLSFNHANA